MVEVLTREGYTGSGVVMIEGPSTDAGDEWRIGILKMAFTAYCWAMR